MESKQQFRTYVYVDGFNLYYGCLKNSPYKWLDLKQLFVHLLKLNHEILRIKYFTAMVSSPPNDPQKAARQEVYLRALRAYIPEIEIYLGHFLSKPVRAPLTNPTGRQRYAEVIRTEEKGSDVNLAVHLLNDAWLDEFDCAVVASNDSDLAESMRLVKSRGKILGLITPGKRRTSRQLRSYATFVKSIRSGGVLEASQLPDPIPGTRLHKPAVC
jgi:uncharacterized LabA/DUF88 family protein